MKEGEEGDRTDKGVGLRYLSTLFQAYEDRIPGELEMARDKSESIEEDKS